MSGGGDEIAGVIITAIFYLLWELYSSVYVITGITDVFAILTLPEIGMTQGEAIILLVILAVVGIWALAQTLCFFINFVSDIMGTLYDNRYEILVVTRGVINGLRGFFKEYSRTTKIQDDL